MKRIGVCLGLLLASWIRLSGQVTVEVTLDQDQFLPGEALPAAIRIINRSGQALTMGAEPDWMTFSVESQEGSVVTKLSDPILGGGEFELPSAMTAIKRLNLAPHFAIDHVGRFGITATVRIKNWSSEVSSKPKFFDVIEGTRLWDQAFGLPTTNSASDVPEVRKYILQEANYGKRPLRLYLRVVDASGRPIRVALVGMMLSFSRPEPHVDELSNLHLLYQVGPQAFSYTVYNPDGALLARQTYDYVGARPRIGVNELGKTSIIGGVRRLTREDVPRSLPPSSFEEPALKGIISTNAESTNAVSTNAVAEPKP